jgi:hypothetical protein
MRISGPPESRSVVDLRWEGILKNPLLKCDIPSETAKTFLLIYDHCIIVTFPYVHIFYPGLDHPSIIFPFPSLPFLKWLQQDSIFYIHTFVESTSTIFTFLYPPPPAITLPLMWSVLHFWNNKMKKCDFISYKLDDHYNRATICELQILGSCCFQNINPQEG